MKFISKNSLGAIYSWVLRHKILSVVILLVIVFGGRWTYGKVFPSSTQTQYILGEVKRGTIVSSVSASGQVSASSQLDIKPKASGEVVYLGVKPGQYVEAGTLIAQLDTTDAQKSIRDAEANLESAQISLEKLKKPATELTLIQARNSLTNAKDSLSKLYTDSHTHIVNVFLDLTNIMTNLEDILIGDDASNGQQWNIDYYRDAVDEYDNRVNVLRDVAYSDYLVARKTYDSAFYEYQSLGNNPNNEEIEETLNDTYEAIQTTSKSIKSANAIIQLYVDTIKTHNSSPSSIATNAITNLNTYTGKINTHLTNLFSDINSLKQDKQTIDEKQKSLDETLAGADELDIRSSELSLTKAQNTLTDAKSNLADYYVRAPFAGTIASLDIQKYETVGSGSAVATLITSRKIAELSLNEVDATKIKVGNKATLTFDAIDDLTLTGEVAEVDSVGAVSQGVVSYSVKVSFDSQDERIKSGMTANATIQTEVKQDVLIIPSSAVKTQGGSSFVQVFNSTIPQNEESAGIVTSLTPTSVQVITGISDDINIEIVSGLDEGQKIAERTMSGTTTTTNTTTSDSRSGFGGAGIRL